MDQEGVHSLRFALQPAVRIVDVAVLPENVWVAVDNPRVHTQDHLKRQLGQRRTVRIV